MSVIDFIERVSNSDAIAVECTEEEITIAIEKPSSSKTRRRWRLVAGFAVIFLAFYLLSPIEGLSHWTPIILAVVSCAWFVALDLVMERYRASHYHKVLITGEDVRIGSMASSGCPIPLDFQIHKVVVTTTIPLIRGEIQLLDLNSSRVLKICEGVPYHLRYHAAREIAQTLKIEFASDRELSAREREQLEEQRG